MAQTPTAGGKSRTAFRILAIAALVSAFVQVTLGGVVRVTGSGLGCPDWPLCHGQLIPPFEFATLIEYTHRLSASLLGLLVLALFIVVLRRYRRNRWAMNSTGAALLLVIAASLLGGATVLTELSWWLRLLHLAIAEGVAAALVVAVVVGWRIGAPGAQPTTPSAAHSVGFARLTATALIGTLVLILSGSFIVGLGYGSSCAEWPLCRGSLFPDGVPYATHMSHRYFAAIVGVLVLVAAWSGWRRRGDAASVGWAALLLALAFALQVMAGAFVIWEGFTPTIKAVHLSMATLVWIALVFMAALAQLPEWFGVADAATRRSQTTAEVMRT